MFSPPENIFPNIAETDGGIDFQQRETRKRLLLDIFHPSLRDRN
jgi:hypothetical protein